MPNEGYNEGDFPPPTKGIYIIIDFNEPEIKLGEDCAICRVLDDRARQLVADLQPVTHLLVDTDAWQEAVTGGLSRGAYEARLRAFYLDKLKSLSTDLSAELDDLSKKAFKFAQLSDHELEALARKAASGRNATRAAFRSKAGNYMLSRARGAKDMPAYEALFQKLGSNEKIIESSVKSSEKLAKYSKLVQVAKVKGLPSALALIPLAIEVAEAPKTPEGLTVAVTKGAIKSGVGVLSFEAGMWTGAAVGTSIGGPFGFVAGVLVGLGTVYVLSLIGDKSADYVGDKMQDQFDSTK